MKELMIIQQELKAPKNQYNSFGKYNYRSLEDILEAVKPLLKKTKCVLMISDKIVNIGTKNYVEATATLLDESGKILCTNTAYAREAESQKGMNDSQLTGSTSSYARKYALNGLFLIDDNKDSDDNKNNVHKESNYKELVKLVKEHGVLQSKESQREFFEKYGKAWIKKGLTQSEVGTAIVEGSV